MAGAGVAPAQHSSKLARALGENVPDRSQALSPKPKGPAGEVLLAYLNEQVHALTEQDPLVRLDAEDAVHRMRVATRRMRSALATYGKLLKDTEAVRFLRDELKWLAGVLGEARDAEVMHDRLKEMIAKEPEELVMGPVARRVDIELGADYQQAHDRALEALDSQRYFHLVEKLGSFLAAPVLTTEGTEPARNVIPKLFKRDIKRLRSAVQEAKNHPAGTGDHPALHEARKDGKRLRIRRGSSITGRPEKGRPSG